MAQEKGLARLGGRPLVAHVVGILADITDEVVVAVAKGKEPSYREVLGADITITEDERGDIGPLEGLVRALQRAKGEYALVSPCDTPFLSAPVCREVSARAVRRDGAVPRVGRFLEPLHAVYRKDVCLEVFRAAVDRGSYKLADALVELDLEFVDEERLRELDPHLDGFWNLNSPEDLEMAEQRLRRREGR